MSSNDVLSQTRATPQRVRACATISREIILRDMKMQLLGGNWMTEDCFRIKTVLITKGFSGAPPTLPHRRIWRENSCSWVEKQISTTNLGSSLILIFSVHIHRQEAGTLRLVPQRLLAEWIPQQFNKAKNWPTPWSWSSQPLDISWQMLDVYKKPV